MSFPSEKFFSLLPGHLFVFAKVQTRESSQAHFPDTRAVLARHVPTEESQSHVFQIQNTSPIPHSRSIRKIADYYRKRKACLKRRQNKLELNVARSRCYLYFVIKLMLP